MQIYGVGHLACLFRDYNIKYFGGVLPLPMFEITESYKFFGYFHSNIWNNTTVDPLIQISGLWDYSEAQIRDIMVHEMIHYYLAYKGIDTTASHGLYFHQYAARFNRDYGMHITVTIDYNEYKRNKNISTFKFWLLKLFSD